RARGRGRTPRGRPRHRRLDGALHRDAGDGRARRLPGRRPRTPARARLRRGAARAGARGGAGRGTAPVACLRGDASLGRPRRRGGHMTLEIAEFRSPIGTLVLAVRDGRLAALEFAERWQDRRACLSQRFGDAELRRAADPAGVASRLAAYFGGDLAVLDRVAVDAGGTAFQRRVWAALRSIPPGETVSYQTLAQRIGAP